MSQTADADRASSPPWHQFFDSEWLFAVAALSFFRSASVGLGLDDSITVATG